MTPSQAWAEVIDAATLPYKRAGRFAWYIARGKLGADPVFRHILEQGLIPPGARVLDLGCGQGLLASLLVAAEEWDQRGQWPNAWAAAPKGAMVYGIELMESKVRRARDALRSKAEFTQGDMRELALPRADVVVILDVLHYIDYASQRRLLERAKLALERDGLLLLRVGDRNGGLPFYIGNWVDQIVTFLRGQRLSRLFCRPLWAWITQLQDLGLSVDARPMSRGTPFANVLLIARLDK